MSAKLFGFLFLLIPVSLSADFGQIKSGLVRSSVRSAYRKSVVIFDRDHATLIASVIVKRAFYLEDVRELQVEYGAQKGKNWAFTVSLHKGQNRKVIAYVLVNSVTSRVSIELVKHSLKESKLREYYLHMHLQGLISDRATAISVAGLMFRSLYGENTLRNVTPLVARLKDGRWTVLMASPTLVNPTGEAYYDPKAIVFDEIDGRLRHVRMANYKDYELYRTK